jgi:hypothetical protein
VSAVLKPLLAEQLSGLATRFHTDFLQGNDVWSPVLQGRQLILESTDRSPLNIPRDES